ncbi:TonB-linked outer membrane protein, SusC/RagA family [Filimonas lacunae]|uniref:TonB-linked outer membrane protein, SusC/RagA family n=1 Tax=Filimonas lacunae TaxID=477680 RepID=A0A173MET8_9BACT|nr:TonB-dependent receptor [Filimonas lacunae]BAV06030.1 TonB-dependent receptor [Filimonas lacunae]SIT24297.1 TonB-linked outer membrane protein, SusC/RagA family [Filimonas lacunae]
MKKNTAPKGLPGCFMRIKLLLLLVAHCLCLATYAHPPAVITGKVITETGEPLSGVSVLIKGSNKGTTTNQTGSFSITAATGDVLEFSIVGYKKVTVTVGTETNITIRLQADVTNLNDIVVVGYGSQRRSTLTGAVSSVSGKTLGELPVAGVDQALQGRVTGLNVTNNGSPGDAPIIAIRGISSIGYATDPLYVIDGFPSANMTYFDAKDVESIEVLKDASAAAIYGSRATNGVIMITTKKGKRDGKLQVNLDSYVGIQSPWKKIDLLNTQQYQQYAKALLGEDGYNSIPRLQPANFNSPIYSGATQTYAQTNTDWQDEYFVRNALITQHNLSLSGGTDKSRFYTSSGYFKQDGIAQGLGFERGNFRVNSEHKLSKVFTFGENLYLSVNKQKYEGTGGNRSPLTNVVRMQPYLPVYDPTLPGGFRGPNSSFDASDPTNPVEGALVGYNTRKTLKILGTAYLDINLTPWLKARSTYGVDYSNLYQQQYIPIFDDGGTGTTPTAKITNERQLYTTQLFTQQLTFDKLFHEHHVNVTAVYEQQGQSYIDETASGNQNNNNVKTLNGASNIAANSRLEENFILSYVGRLTYDFAGKYMLSASMRRDGLSVFAPGHKYKNFPAASIGWKLDKESFLNGIPEISELKIRAGYGLTGINGTVLGNYPYQLPVQGNQTDYPFNGTISGPNGSFYNRQANPDLEWEVTKQLNFGVDLGLFGNRVTLTAEYFRRKTDNLIIKVPLPPSFGYGTATDNLPPINVASMQNNGFEVQLGYHKTQGAFKWDISGLVSAYRNKVLKLNTENASFTGGADADFGNGDITNTVVGQPIQSFYGYVTDGIFQNAEEVTKAAVQVAGATSAGDIRFKDLKPDGKITSEDRTFIGSYLPKFSYSLNYTASYKNFDAGVFFQGVQGNKIFNAERVIVEGMVRLFNSGTNVLNAWTPTNTRTDIPRAVNGDPNGNSRVSTRWIENGSFLRVKNLMIGYTLPESALQSLTKNTITRFRVYVSSQNLFTFTGYKGWDPEIGSRRNTLTNGIDYGQYPSARSFQLGVQVGF